MAGVDSSSSFSDMGDVLNETFDDADDLAIDADVENEDIVVVDEDDEEPIEDQYDEVDVGAAMEAMDFEVRFKNKPHPLLIPSVVNEMCQYLQTRDLENVRSVSRLWNKESCNILRKTRLVEFADVDSIARYNRRMATTMDFPHTSFQLWNEDISDNEPNIKQFFSLFGEHIKSLDFQQLTLDGDHLFDILWRKAPNLESLTLHNVPRQLFPTALQCPAHPIQFTQLKNVTFIQFSSDGSQPRAFLHDLIQASPNLEKISLAKSTGADGVRESEPWLGTFLFESVLNHSSSLTHLSQLDFIFRLREENVEPLINKQFPLVSLEVLLDSNLKPRSFARLCAALSRTLHTASFTFQDKSAVAKALPAYELQNVTSLSLTGFKGNLMIIEDMPGLKKLALTDISLQTALPLQEFTKIHNHELTYFKSTEDASDRDVVARIARCFNGLTSLHLNQLGDEGLGIIYRELPYISELILTNGTFTDSGISGVPAEVCNDLWETMTIFDNPPERFRRDLFIGSLPYLRKARLESNYMTDLAIMFGLVSCTKLNSLCLKSTKITDISMPTIGDKMRKNLTFLDVIHCPEITEAGKYILKQKLDGARLIFEPPAPTTTRIRRARPADLHDREAERFGIQRDRLVELARAREIELRFALRIYHQLQNMEGHGLNFAGRRHHIIQNILRRHPNRERHVNPAEIAGLIDVIHLDHQPGMEDFQGMDLNDNALDAAALAAAAAAMANEFADVEEGFEIPEVPLEGAMGGVAAAGRLGHEFEEFFHQFQHDEAPGPHFFRDDDDSDDERLNNNNEVGVMDNDHLFPFVPPGNPRDLDDEPEGQAGIPPTPPPFV